LELVGPTDLHPVGNFSFDFKIKIPENAASSLFWSKDACKCCDGSRIFVKYYLTLVLDVPWRRKFKAKKEIEIVRNDDLNLMPFIREKVPFVTSETVKLNKLLKSCGQVHVKVTLPYGGFVRGEKMPILIATKNESDIKFHEIDIALVQAVVSYNPKKNKTFESFEFTNNVSSKRTKINEIDGLGKLVCELLVPQDALFSNGPFCDVVKVTYKLKVLIFGSGLFTSNAKVEVPIIVGNVEVLLRDDEKKMIDQVFRDF
jgi:Arrestin (or S-antigen), C-terminal domain/Arrestin (or S-antigen), N-terminal domain